MGTGDSHLSPNPDCQVTGTPTLVRSAAGISILSREYPHILCCIFLLRIAPSFTRVRRECGPRFIPGCEHNAVRNPLSIVITASIWTAGGFLSGAMNTTMAGFKHAAKGNDDLPLAVARRCLRKLWLRRFVISSCGTANVRSAWQVQAPISSWLRGM